MAKFHTLNNIDNKHKCIPNVTGAWFYINVYLLREKGQKLQSVNQVRQCIHNKIKDSKTSTLTLLEKNKVIKIKTGVAKYVKHAKRIENKK